MPELGPEYYSFINWVENFEPHISFDNCNVGLIEDYEFIGDTWDYRYKTVMKNECRNWNFEITVYMATEEWENLEEVYVTYKEDGSKDSDSVVKECTEELKDGIQQMACTFFLGHYPDWESKGLGHPEQRTAAWLNKSGDYGIRGYSYHWSWAG